MFVKVDVLVKKIIILFNSDIRPWPATGCRPKPKITIYSIFRQHFFSQIFFRPKIFSAKDFFGHIFSAKDFFGQNIFFSQKICSDKTFFSPKRDFAYLAENIFVRKSFGRILNRLKYPPKYNLVQNLHEPYRDDYDFTGDLDVAKFIELAGDLDLLVIFRPGPYICAEWEWGGHPYWLLHDKDMLVRTTYDGYAAAVSSFYRELFGMLNFYYDENVENLNMSQLCLIFRENLKII